MKHHKLQLFLLLCSLAVSQAFALPSDRNQPLKIQSDDFESDEISETTTYTGSVILEQGSMKIMAEKLVIQRKDDKITRVVATGFPARYSQVPKLNQEPVNATANRIEYRISKEMLYLIDNASLDQEGSNLSGDRIEYDVKQSVVKAGSKRKTANKKRVKMVIPPKSFTERDR